MKRTLALIAALLLTRVIALAAPEPWPGDKTDFHGAALYNVPVANFSAAVLVPDQPAAGRPWVLAPSLYNFDSAPVANMTRTELALVKRGLHVVAAGPSVPLGAPDPAGRLDAVYRELTSRYGLATRPVLMGLSREGLAAARWAAANPGKCSALYLDKAVCDFKSWPGGKLGVGKGSARDWAQLLQVYHFRDEAEALAFKESPVDLAPKLVADKVAILYLTGAADEVVPFAENGKRVQEQYAKLGGVFELIVRPGEGHHPHGLADPTPVVDFIVKYAGTQAPPVEVRPAALFADHLVLQRERPAPIWGSAAPGAAVTVTFAGQTKVATADAAGNWRVTLDPLPASAEPRTLRVNDQVINDVLVGEVWLASGQSNMGFNVAGSLGAEQAIASSADAQLRAVNVPACGDVEPRTGLPGARWEVAGPTTVGRWSGVAYYYARCLREALGVPVGLVHASVGGTPAESWTSGEALARDPLFAKAAADSLAAWRSYPADVRAFPLLLAAWMKQYHAEDPGGAGEAQGWAKPEFDDAGWRDVTIPTALRPLGMKGGGVVWFRKTIALPPDAADKDTWIGTNWVDDAAQTVYFNGVRLDPIGAYQPYYHKQWRFKLPRQLIRPGAPNTLTLRLHCLWPDRGFWQWTKELNLPLTDPARLDNRWKFKVETEFPALSPEAAQALPRAPTANILLNTHTSLYNAMIHPLIPFALKGVIWYQGESNAGRSSEYRRLLSLLIGDWRARWGQGDLPFYLVQLANYGDPATAPGESGVAAVREAQRQVAESVPGTGLAVAIDLGEVNIHPRNKLDVGRRLALQALAKTYGRPVACESPTYRSLTVEGQAIRLKFDHAAGGLVAKGAAPKWFAIAGADGKFVWAEAQVEGETVVVSSPRVPQPAAVRYAWADNPEGCNVYNQAGLPLAPFRSDTGSTR